MTEHVWRLITIAMLESGVELYSSHLKVFGLVGISAVVSKIQNGQVL